MNAHESWTLQENLIVTTYLREYREMLAKGSSKSEAHSKIINLMQQEYPDIFNRRSYGGIEQHIAYWDRLTNGEKIKVSKEDDRKFIGLIPNHLTSSPRN